MLPNLIHMKGLSGFPNHRLSCRKLLKSLGVSIQKISTVNNKKKKGNLNVSNLFFTVNCFFPSFSPPSLFLAVEDNVTEDQQSPGQTAIPSGNAPFHISSFSAGKWIMFLDLCACLSVCTFFVGFRMKLTMHFLFLRFSYCKRHGCMCLFTRRAQWCSSSLFVCLHACIHAGALKAVLVFLCVPAVFLDSLFPNRLYDVE